MGISREDRLRDRRMSKRVGRSAQLSAGSVAVDSDGNLYTEVDPKVGQNGRRLDGAAR